MMLSIEIFNVEFHADQMDSTLEEEEDKIGPWRLDPPGNSNEKTKEPEWPSLANSAYFDSFPTCPVEISGREDLPELLANLRLTQYVEVFRANEVLSIFRLYRYITLSMSRLRIWKLSQV